MSTQIKQISDHGETPRVAIVDLLFCWPPNGGADVDLYNVAAGLCAKGMDIKVFVLRLEGSRGRGQFVAGTLPFPAEAIRIAKEERQCRGIAAAIKAAVDEWKPDVVLLAHGFALKAHVARALAGYPVIGRYYAHELLCARDPLRYKNNGPCEKSIFETPKTCRECAFESLSQEIKSGAPRAWAEDYLTAAAYGHDFHVVMREAVATMAYVIVSNQELADELAAYAKNITVIPGGTNVRRKKAGGGTDAHGEGVKKTIFMPGRVEDPLKGLGVLMDAARRLEEKRDDYHIKITHFDTAFTGPHMSSVGWLSHEETLAYYEQSDMCVVPSVWREPFGLVAVEAMAAGLPVCASDIGGLRDIVVDGETGLLFPPGDGKALAAQMERLLDDAALRAAMGNAGYKRVLAHYTWDAVIERHYLPLFSAFRRGKPG